MVDEQAELGWSSTARGIDAFYDRALAMLASPKVKAAFDLSTEPDALRDAYGRTTYGQSCLLARRLVEAGVRFVTVYYSDSIGQGDTRRLGHPRRELPEAPQPPPAVDRPDRPDLHRRPGRAGPARRDPGRLDGRVRPLAQGGQHHPVRPQRPRPLAEVLHRPDGRRRDHAGAIYGSSDRIGAYPATDPVTPDDIAATMFWALGIDPATEVLDTLGRPLPIASGKPLTRLFG